MLASTLTTAALFFLGAVRTARASPCVAMDANFNLYAFGLNGKDWNAGTQDSWGSSSQAKDVTASGRPPFDGANTTCYLAQFFNAIYVLNGDASDKAAIYIYDAANAAWSKQAVTTGAFDPTNFQTILDHDTNVFYALSGGELYSLDLGSQTTAKSSALAWNDVEKAGLTTTGYNPVMAIAQNHIFFLDVPGNSAGQASIFVIHFSYWQPEVQSFPASSGSSFPAAHGQVSSFFQPSAAGGVQQEFAYIPDDGSATYVINVESNTTATLAAPPSADANSRYFAGVTSLVQLASNGAVNYLPYTEGQASANAGAKWAPVAAFPAAAGGSSGGSSSGAGSGSSSGAGSATGGAGASQTGAKTGAGASQTGAKTGAGTSPSGTSSAPSTSPSSAALAGQRAALGLAGAAALAVAAFLA